MRANMPRTSDRHVNEKPFRIALNLRESTPFYPLDLQKIAYSKGVRIFDYAQFTAPLRDRVREQAAAIAREAGIAIEHIAKRHIRKEEVVAKVLAERGDHPGWGCPKDCVSRFL